MLRRSSTWLIAIGLLHSVLGIVWAAGSPALRAEFIRSGLLDAVNDHSPRATFYFWFLLAGFCMILLGQLGLWAERALQRPLPAFVGWELLVIALFGVVLDPDSGFWLLLALAIYILVTAQRAARGARTGRQAEDQA
ncbi:MAG: hypothetical protein HY234_07255 [Acidobacteria bacterium]|nr:hypothetical protein [Acidobacteriota bacterium]MBI3662831.1 hypothetical protein [Acidobacteriota bacterium]